MITKIQSILNEYYQVTGENIAELVVGHSVFTQLQHDMAVQTVYGCDPSDEPGVMLIDGTRVRWS